MVDLGWVNDRIAVGAAISTQEAMQALADAGVKAVIDMQAEHDDHLTPVPGVAVLWTPWQDDGTDKPIEDWQRIGDFFLQVMATPGKLYFHCAAGINRGPSACYFALRLLGFNSTAAEILIRNCRPQVGLAYKANADRVLTQLGY